MKTIIIISATDAQHSRANTEVIAVSDRMTKAISLIKHHIESGEYEPLSRQDEDSLYNNHQTQGRDVNYSLMVAAVNEFV